VREIRMLRARWRGLETGPRNTLHGHEGGNPGYGQGHSYGLPRQSSTLPHKGGPGELCHKPSCVTAVHQAGFEDRCGKAIIPHGISRRAAPTLGVLIPDKLVSSA
jgi:hypothetical protein